MNNIDSYDSYPDEIKKAIINRWAVAAADTSIDEHCMAVCWVSTTLENQVHRKGHVCSTKWITGQIPVAKGIRVLNLIKEINNKTNTLLQEK